MEKAEGGERRGKECVRVIEIASLVCEAKEMLSVDGMINCHFYFRCYEIEAVLYAEMCHARRVAYW